MYMGINIDKDLRLELTTIKYATDLYKAVDINREHLSQFLPWVPHMRSAEDTRDYIKNCERLYEQGEEVSFVIIADESIVGRIGLHHINIQNKNAAIGYWLTKNAEGRGIITKSCKEIIAYGFQKLDLHRIEIKVATDNIKSQAIPKKLRFTKEGILRQAELVNNKFLDLILYSVIKDEWIKNISDIG